jgi:excisionase family DNA binding protein
MSSKDFYTAQALADKLGVNVMTIYRYIKASKIKAYKFGKEFRIEAREFESFLKKHQT